MTDVVIVIEEESPSVVIQTTEHQPNISIPSNSNVASLSDLTDVSVNSATDGQVLTKRGSIWQAEDVVDTSIKTPLDGGEFM